MSLLRAAGVVFEGVGTTRIGKLAREPRQLVPALVQLSTEGEFALMVDHRPGADVRKVDREEPRLLGPVSAVEALGFLVSLVLHGSNTQARPSPPAGFLGPVEGYSYCPAGWHATP